MTKEIQAIQIHLRGLVQGVGFRPFIYRLALLHNINGWVANNNEGVLIHAEAFHDRLDLFLTDIVQQSPPASNIQFIDRKSIPIKNYSDFSIHESRSLSDAVTGVSPDIAVCEECLKDMKSQAHRTDYPFINCTNCGPRFTIIKSLPYDRHLTTMHPFGMCETCKREYTSILDRRFHAQPVACLNCGPAYTILPDGNPITNGRHIATIVASAIDSGQLVALKGMGGYHLLCDATNETAVSNLLYRKNRDGKPMAVMMEGLAQVQIHFHLNESEEKALCSWRRPIVLLKNKLPLAPSVSNGLNTTGIIVPYMPLHYQLFHALKTKAIVLTSGNISDEPVIISDVEAYSNLSQIADLVVGYNREIHNRADDSVVFNSTNKTRLIRRSRGYAPSPIEVNLYVEGIFAAGAELNNTFAIGKGKQAILSQHIGDLKNAETLAFYEESFDRFTHLFRFKPELVVCDSHPDYLSSQFARSLGIQTIEVQHHHAHIASCMAEHALDEKVIGIAFDGTGYGDDGTIWGGEFLVCDLNQSERKYHFDPIPLPGGDQVTTQPWRTALSCLYAYFGKALFSLNIPMVENIPSDQSGLIIQMIEKGINTPLSSSAGRLFDAVAALTGICHESTYHAEAPMLLEAAINKNCRGKYLFDIEDGRIIFRKMFNQICKDIKANTDKRVMAAKFHNTIIASMLTISRKIKDETGLRKVVLSGGSFQNRYLLELSEKFLKEIGFEVYTQSQIPSNDGGLALGQIAIGAKRRSLAALQ